LVLAVAEDVVQRHELVHADGKLDIAALELRGVFVARRVRERNKLAAKATDERREAQRLAIDIHTALAPFVHRRNTRGTLAGVAAARLDAADGHHRLARDRDHVTTHGEGHHRAIGKAELAGADPHHVARNTLLQEDFINARE